MEGVLWDARLYVIAPGSALRLKGQRGHEGPQVSEGGQQARVKAQGSVGGDGLRGKDAQQGGGGGGGGCCCSCSRGGGGGGGGRGRGGGGRASAALDEGVPGVPDHAHLQATAAAAPVNQAQHGIHVHLAVEALPAAGAQGLAQAREGGPLGHVPQAPVVGGGIAKALGWGGSSSARPGQVGAVGGGQQAGLHLRGHWLQQAVEHGHAQKGRAAQVVGGGGQQHCASRGGRGGAAAAAAAAATAAAATTGIKGQAPQVAVQVHASVRVALAEQQLEEGGGGKEGPSGRHYHALPVAAETVDRAAHSGHLEGGNKK